MEKKKKKRIEKILNVLRKIKKVIVEPKFRIYYVLILIIAYLIFYKIGAAKAETLKDADYYLKNGRFARNGEWIIKPNSLSAYARSLYPDHVIPNDYPDSGYGLTVALIGLSFAILGGIFEYFREDS